MKIYVMSRTKDGKSLIPKASRDFKNLSVEMTAEYDKVIKDADHLGHGYLSDDGTLVAHYGASKFTWRIDEIKC